MGRAHVSPHEKSVSRSVSMRGGPNFSALLWGTFAHNTPRGYSSKKNSILTEMPCNDCAWEALPPEKSAVTTDHAHLRKIESSLARAWNTLLHKGHVRTRASE